MDKYEFDDNSEMNEELYDESYRRKRLVESLAGPVLSTLFHVSLIIVLALLVVDKVLPKEKDDIHVTVQPKVEPIEIPKPETQEVEKPIPITEVTPIAQPMTVVDVETVDPMEDLTEDQQDTPEISDEPLLDTVESVVVTPMGSPNIGNARTPDGIKSKLAVAGVPGAGPAVLKALDWLQKVQKPDGSWGTAGQSAYTGLAVLTFLAHGETQNSKKYGVTVRKGLEWLVYDPINKTGHHGYPHAIKTYALADAYAMTGMSVIEERLKECLEVLVKGIQEGGSYDYGYKSSQARQDLSFAGWNYQALKAAYGAGVELEGLEEAISKSVVWLKGAADSDKSFPYSMSNNDPSTSKGAGKHTMRAVGVLCLQLFGEGNYEGIQDELKIIAESDIKKLDWQKAPGRSLYGWYYATNALFQSENKRLWTPWKKKFVSEVSKNQHNEGYWEYPNMPNHIPGDSTSQKVYATTMSALMLTVFYRYLPSSMVVKPKKRMADLKEDEGIDLVE
ncbi:MAG: hypothetical protein NE330_20500 [Lentisphaeraceae bacterium]|nr:hypothetical protein [Lentisphaeraceae bacterium]